MRNTVNTPTRKSQLGGACENMRFCQMRSSTVVVRVYTVVSFLGLKFANEKGNQIVNVYLARYVTPHLYV